MSDIVVVGAGHNGLTAACYLARAGHRVCVLEATSSIGGMTSSRALIEQAPEHLVSPCAIDAVYWKASSVERELGLARFGLRTVDHDPAWVWLGDDGSSLLLRHDLDQTIREIRRFSPADALTYAEFAETAMAALAVQDRYGEGRANRPSPRAVATALRGLADRRVRRLLGAALTRSAAELATDLFRSEPMRGAFASMASILGSITQDGSGIGMLATAPLHRYGVCRPIGGMQAIPDALARCLTAAGGTIQLEAPVENILVQRGVANGVSLRGGKEIRADWVVAAIPPQVTGALLSSDIPGIEVLRSAPANAAGIGCFKVDFALRGQVAPARHAQERDDGVDLRRPTMFIGTLAQIITAEHEARTGRFPTCPPLTATILSAVDPTQAPSDQDILYVYAPAPVVPNDGWDAVRPGAEKRLVEATSAVLGDITGLEIGRAVETPQDLQDRLGAVNGCIYHVDQAVTRLGPLRPGLGWAGHRTRVPGLVLCGAGTHPGGGVSGIPGQLAARALLRRGR